MICLEEGADAFAPCGFRGAFLFHERCLALARRSRCPHCNVSLPADLGREVGLLLEAWRAEPVSHRRRGFVCARRYCMLDSESERGAWLVVEDEIKRHLRLLEGGEVVGDVSSGSFVLGCARVKVERVAYLGECGGVSMDGFLLTA